MHKKLVGAAVALAFVALALPSLAAAQSTGLTSTQVSAIISLLESFGASSIVVASVESALGGQTTATAPTCVNLTYDLYAGVTDSQSAGQVSLLQSFLGISPTTGYFGPETEQAVENYQSSHGIVSSGSPDTTGYGFVGPQTRAAIGCSGSQSTTPSNPTEPNIPAAFTASPSSGAAPLTVTFTITGPDNGFSLLDNGDGEVDNVSVPSTSSYDNISCSTSGADETCQGTHTYTSPGTYIAKLETASGSAYVEQTVTVTSGNTTPNTPSTPSTLSSSANGLTVNITQSAVTTTSDGTTGQPFTISWTSTGASACSITYASPGDLASGTSSGWATGTSGSQTASTYQIGPNQWIITCTGTSGTVSQSLIHTVDTAVSTAPNTLSTVTSPVVSTSTTTSATTVAFNASPTYALAPLAVSFSYTNTISGNFYTINFGDGSSGTLAYQYGAISGQYQYVTTHVYSTVGTYTATLTNGSGMTLGTQTIDVVSGSTYQQALPTATLSASPTTIAPGQSTAVTWSSTNATSCTSSQFSTGGATSGSVTVPYIYSATPGSGVVQLVVTCTGSGGQSSGVVNLEESSSSSVVSAPTSAGTPSINSFVVEPVATYPIMTGQTFYVNWYAISMSSCSLTPPSGVTATGSGSTAGTEGSLTYTTPTPGTYTYSLNCTGTNGNPYTAQVAAVVTANPATAAQVCPSGTTGTYPSCTPTYALTATPASGPGPANVAITAQLPKLSNPNTMSYIMDFGDGSLSNGSEGYSGNCTQIVCTFTWDHIYTAPSATALTATLTTTANFTAALHAITTPSGCGASSTGSCGVQALTNVSPVLSTTNVSVSGGPVNLLSTTANSSNIATTEGLNPYTVTFDSWAPTNGPFSPYLVQFEDGSPAIVPPTCTPGSNGICTTPATFTHTFNWYSTVPSDSTNAAPVTFVVSLSGTNNPYGGLGAVEVTVASDTPANEASMSTSGVASAGGGIDSQIASVAAALSPSQLKSMLSAIETLIAAFTK